MTTIFSKSNSHCRNLRTKYIFYLTSGWSDDDNSLSPMVISSTHIGRTKEMRSGKGSEIISLSKSESGELGDINFSLKLPTVRLYLVANSDLIT